MFLKSKQTTLIDILYDAPNQMYKNSGPSQRKWRNLASGLPCPCSLTHFWCFSVVRVAVKRVLSYGFITQINSVDTSYIF